MQAELKLAKTAVREALMVLARIKPAAKTLRVDTDLPREMKAGADRILEDILVKKLTRTGLEILSEETGLLPGRGGDSHRWVVDPLDGTVNFSRGLGSCATSVALCHGSSPVWGVLGEFPSGKLAWGGRGQGAYVSGRPIHVSSISKNKEAVLCTGFPSRFVFKNHQTRRMNKWFCSFGKVRMLGSAAFSLLQLARGVADAYTEQAIMWWDVAAGLAILDGAGGVYKIRQRKQKYALDVLAGNGRVTFPKK